MKQKKKIRKSAQKRFKITKNGKVLFGHQNKGHLQRKKSAKVSRRHKEPGHLTGAFAKRVKQMMGEL